MTRLLRTVWRMSLAPVYYRLFRRYFDAILREVKEMRSELYTHIAGINTRQGAVNARQGAVNEEVIARLDELERYVRTAIAAGWDDMALARRMASIEDQLERFEPRLAPESEAANARPE